MTQKAMDKKFKSGAFIVVTHLQFGLSGDDNDSDNTFLVNAAMATDSRQGTL
jgi:hypothetical protein